MSVVYVEGPVAMNANYRTKTIKLKNNKFPIYEVVLILSLLEHLKKFQHCCAQEQGQTRPSPVQQQPPPTKPRELTMDDNQLQQVQIHSSNSNRILNRSIVSSSSSQTQQIIQLHQDQQQQNNNNNNSVTVQTSLAQAIHQLQPNQTLQNFQNTTSYQYQIPENIQINQNYNNNSLPNSTVTTSHNNTNNSVPPVSLSSLVLPGLLNLLHEQENSNETDNK